MTTQFPYRVTIICPEALMPAAKELAMVYGYSEADRNTFGDTPGYQDTAGNLYAVASTVVRETFPATASAAPVRPAWDTEGVIDMMQVQAAWDALVVYDPETPVQAYPSRLLAIVNDDPQEALEWAGVTRIPMEDDIV